MDQVFADLHIHTPNSDGEVTLEELPDIAKDNDLGAVAVTDHDRIHQDLDSPIKVIDGIDVISGLELRVEAEDGQRIDILGYGVEQNKNLRKILDEVQENRIARSNEIIDRIEEDTGVRIDVDVSDNTGRPHIARAVSENEELDYNYQDAFDELIGSDCYAYVSRDIPSFTRAIYAMRDCCHTVSLAHPYRYDDPVSALGFSKRLDAVECKYPYDEDIEMDYDSVAVEWFNLEYTGGSDSHNIDSIGSCGLTEDEYRNLLVETELDEYSKYY